jgi:phytoene synthase
MGVIGLKDGVPHRGWGGGDFWEISIPNKVRFLFPAPLVMLVAESYARCEALARSHYENFPVARMLPKALRPHVAAIYAFARTADDIADEGYGLPGGGDGSPAAIQGRLDALRRMDARCLAAVEGGDPGVAEDGTDWIFPALGDTLRKFGIPAQLCLDLTSAFAQDVVKRSYADFDEVLDYCRRSANPVGRIVLLLHGYSDARRFAQSDAICTALQLANFWQDIAVDWKKDQRTYLPLEDLRRFGVPRESLGEAVASEPIRECVRFNVERAQSLFDKGRPLAASLCFPLSLEIRATWLGGVTILRKIRAQGYDTLRSRPRINAADKLRLLFRAFLPL